MARFSHEPIFEAACQSGQLPGVVLVAGDATGKFKYAKAFGKNAHGESLALDSVMWMASNTKIITAVAALQQVQRGKVGLDDDITNVFPEIAALKVFTGYDEKGKPTYEERKNPITLRTLLTHTSGITHPLFSPKIGELEKVIGAPATTSRTVLGDCIYPLEFQPGKGWMYGLGLDVAGQLIERLSGLSLEEYMRANIWDPLDAPHVSFAPDAIPDMKARKIKLSLRSEPGKVVPVTEGYIQQYGGDKDDAYGGAGAWGSAESYSKLLQSLCENDERVLSKEWVEELFRPQLGPEAKKMANEFVKEEAWRRIYGNSFDMDHQVINQALGGMVGTRDEPGRKRAGTMVWGGMPNLIWWIDRESGLWGTVFMNLVPPGDIEANALAMVFEKSIYEQYEEFKKQEPLST